MKVFVYGTLKKGYGNWDRYLRQSELVGRAATVGKFDMTNVGFPYIYPTQSGHRVAGEVFEIDQPTLANLDRLEGEGHHYDRTLQLVELEDGSTELCMTYVAKGRRRGTKIEPENGTLTWKGYRL